MLCNWIFGALAVLSLALLVWQWLAARRFPLHQRIAATDRSALPGPGVTVLKPLKGCDAATEGCLRSWLAQDCDRDLQFLFGVQSADDPAAEVVGRLQREFPKREAALIVCGPASGTNAKVSQLVELAKQARHDVFVVSDADVRVPPDFLANALAPLREPGVGLVSCFYRLANPTTLAMRWEAIAINADFWSQVLQSQSLKPLDFALGAVMIVPRKPLEEIGGFAALADCLADDYQLGNRIARRGHRIALCPVVVECWDPPMNWRAVWKHQLRWARTIRVCQPAPYFFSVLSNAGFWAMLWLAWELLAPCFRPADDGMQIFSPVLATLAFICWWIRILIACDLQDLMTRSSDPARYFWLVPLKDLLQFLIWLGAFAGNRIEWRGHRFKLRRDGTLERL